MDFGQIESSLNPKPKKEEIATDDIRRLIMRSLNNKAVSIEKENRGITSIPSHATQINKSVQNLSAILNVAKNYYEEIGKPAQLTRYLETIVDIYTLFVYYKIELDENEKEIPDDLKWLEPIIEKKVEMRGYIRGFTKIDYFEILTSDMKSFLHNPSTMDLYRAAEKIHNEVMKAMDNKIEDMNYGDGIIFGGIKSEKNRYLFALDYYRKIERKRA